MQPEFFVGLFGFIAFPFFAWLISEHRDKVMWKTVLVGLLIQIVIGIIVLSPPGRVFFRFLNDVIIGLLNFTEEGARFLFGDLVDNEFAGAQFAFLVLPTIVFFSAVMGILYYTGIMQKIVEFIAWIMMKLLDTSGAESLSVASNMFVGQTEAPLVVKPFVEDMTMSELNTVMTGGFATVAGGVMAAYIGMLKDSFPGIAGHLVTASAMSAPAAFVMSKLTFPELEEPKTKGTVRMNFERQDQNLIDAAAQGAKLGMKLALNVGCMLLAFYALIVGVGDFLVEWLSNQIVHVVAEMDGMKAFGPGAIAGYATMTFLVGRTSWSDEETRDWIALVILQIIGACVGSSMGYFLDANLFYAYVIPALTGILLGAAAGLFIYRNQAQKVLNSNIALLAGTVVLGLITQVSGGTNSQFVAAFLSVGTLLFLSVIAYYWYLPSFGRAVVVGITVISGALLAGALISAFNLQFIEILKQLNLQKLIGYLFSSLAFLMGVPWEDLVNFGQLIGTKMSVNEFVAFTMYDEMTNAGNLSPKSVVLASYAMCGFANFSSIGIQIGGIGGIAPSRESDLAKLGFRAMIAGTLASYQTATIAGIIFGLGQLIGVDIVTLQ